MQEINRPLVSIVVPVYNVEKYIDACLTSIVNQTYKNFEVILIDDASPDKSSMRCDFWTKKDKRIRAVHKQKNEGLFQARITGFNIMRGDYFVTIDSDDCVDSDFIEKLLDRALSSNSDIVIAESFRRLHSDGEIEEFRFPQLYTHKNVLNGLVKNIARHKDKFGWNVWGKMYKTTLYSDAKAYLSSVNEHISAGEDILFSIVFAYYSHKASYLRGYAGYGYRENNQSIMLNVHHESITDKIDSVTTAMFSVQQFLELNGLSTYIHKEIGIFKKYLISDSIWAIKNQYINTNEELRQEIGKNQRYIIELEQQITDLKGSRAYKLGRVITLPYVKMRNLLNYFLR